MVLEMGEPVTSQEQAAVETRPSVCLHAFSALSICRPKDAVLFFAELRV